MEPILLSNPRCSKSRAARALLEERGVAFRERRYLEEPLDRAELERLAQALGLAPLEFVRRGEAAWEEAGLGEDPTGEALFEALVRFPILLERPILWAGGRAVIGRPPQRVLELLGPVRKEAHGG